MFSSTDLEEFKNRVREILDSLDRETSFVLLTLKGDVDSGKPLEQNLGGSLCSRGHCMIAVLSMLKLIQDQATNSNDMEFVGQIVGLRRAIENLFGLEEEKVEGDTVH